MTGLFLLDWAIMSISLFNTILLLWLGLTVLLTAERRSWGVWLTGGGMLMGSAFFFSHSAILGTGLHAIGAGMDFWWHVGWVPVIASPLAWYVVMLWFAGFWHARDSRLHRRQRFWFYLTLLLAAALIGLLIFANPLPSYTQVARLDMTATPTIGGIPVLLVAYPLYIVLCITLSLDALRRPEPSGRVMGNLAQRRTHPWLIGASLTLLVVSLLVALVMLWVESNARLRALSGIYDSMTLTVAWFDLVIASLIAVAVILLGQAVVSYEVFTGKTLPRRGFFRHWRSAVILAGGYGVVVGWGLVARLRPIYSLLLTTTLMTVFYALFSWRSFAEREGFMARLRPFVTSQGLVQQLVAAGASPVAGAERIFRALCHDVLDTRLAYLVPLGTLAPLAGPPIRYPPAAEGQEPVLPSLDLSSTPESACVPLDPVHHDGARWAIPLWSARGLIGVLLLGEKQEGGLYTQEEIEIARTSGERLIDMLAGEEMARRLMDLQRRRLAQTQIADRQTRRTLHDEVLPHLHTAILGLSSPARDDPTVQDAIRTLTAVHHQISDLIHAPLGPAPASPGQGDLAQALQEMAESEFKGEFEEVTWRLADELPPVDPLRQEVVYYAVREAVRNATLHGRGGDPQRPLHLEITITRQDGLTIAVRDDGVGTGLHVGHEPDPDMAAGSGRGLALHSTMMVVIGGSLLVENPPGGGTRVVVNLPQEETKPVPAGGPASSAPR